MTMEPGSKNLLDEHRQLGDIELLMWGLQLKLDQWEKGEAPGPPNLEVPPFGRSDVGWPALRGVLEAHRELRGTAAGPGLRNWLRRGIRRVLFGKEGLLPAERLTAFHSATLTGFDHAFVRLESAEAELVQVSRQLLALRQSLESLTGRLDLIEKTLTQERSTPLRNSGES